MADVPLRIGLVGLHGINNSIYRPALRKHPRTTLVAGADPAAGAAEKFRAAENVPVFASLAEMARAVKLDGVMIGSPNHIHLINVREAAALKLPMCVTKPLANTVRECQEAIELCRQAGVVLATGHEWRFHPVMRAVRERVAAGDLGRVSLALAHSGHQGGIRPDSSALKSWRSHPENAPGGCANLLGIHGYDMLNALLGKPRRVSARLDRLFSLVSIVDTAVYTIQYESGQVGVATSSYASASSRGLHVYGTDANLLTPGNDEKLFLEKGGILTELPVSAGAQGESKYSADYVVDMFVRAIADGVPPEIGGTEGLLAVAVLEAGIRSSQENRPVDISEVLSA